MCDPTKDPRRKEYVDPRFLAPGDSSFFLESVFTSTNVYASLTLTWTASTDIFTIDRGGESKLEIPTRCISEIMHCAEKRMILVVSKTDVPSGNIILVVAEPVQNVFKLRSLFERRVGAMKVGLRDWDFFHRQYTSLEDARLGKTKASPQNPILDPGAMSCMSSSGRQTTRISHSRPGFFQETRRQMARRGPKVRPVIAASSPSKGERARAKLERNAEDTPSGRSEPPVAEMKAQKAVTPFAQLTYRDGSPVVVNGLVLRLREGDCMERGYEKHDILDVFDGPWRVAEIPKPTQPVVNLFDSDQDEPVKEFDKKSQHKLILEQKLVKLEFPQSTKANDWTVLARLIPVYSVDPEAPEDCDARLMYHYDQISKRARSCAKASTEAHRPDNIRGVAKLAKGVYDFVDYVEPSGLHSDDVYEIEKLRGAHLSLHHISDEYPLSRMDTEDPFVVQYISVNGDVEDGQVLVARYLIHWAGWPSEDDCWTVGKDNIPAGLIQDYFDIIDQCQKAAETSGKRVNAIAAQFEDYTNTRIKRRRGKSSM